MSADILIVDDEADIRDLVAGILDDEGHRTRTAGSSDEALAAIESRRPHLVFLDIWLQGSRLDGLQVLDLVKAQHPTCGGDDLGPRQHRDRGLGIKAGAYDFIEKPFKADRLILVAERALEASRLKREVRDLKARSGQASRIVGASVAANQLRQDRRARPPTNARVMISGAPGSGKELSARTIHAASTRASGPFVVINAATITPDTMEAELFGIEAAEGRSRRVGRLEEAHGGTLYIDEVADMPRETQKPHPAGARRPELPARRRHHPGSCRRAHHLVLVARPPGGDRGGRFREDLFHRSAWCRSGAGRWPSAARTCPS